MMQDIDRATFVPAFARLRPTPGMWAVAWLALEGDGVPNVTRLAAECGVSRQTIHKDIRRLEAWGVAVVEGGRLAIRPESEWGETPEPEMAPGQLRLVR